MQFSFTLFKNFSPELLELLKENHSRLSHLYLLNPFSFKTDSELLYNRKLKALEKLVNRLKPLNLPLVFAFPATCFGGAELTPRFQAKLLNSFQAVGQLGLKAVSLANLYLVELFSSPFPPYNQLNGFALYLAEQARIDHPLKLRYLDTLKLSLLTLSPRLNRRKDLLSELLMPLPGRVELVANSGCPPFCPLESFCLDLLFHRQEEKLPPRALKTYSAECRRICRQVLELPIISPHRLADYRKLLGIETFQILTPLNNPEKTRQILSAYFSGKAPADLTDLLVRKLPEEKIYERKLKVGTA